MKTRLTCAPLWRSDCPPSLAGSAVSTAYAATFSTAPAMKPGAGTW